jgi:hypothetical protein
MRKLTHFYGLQTSERELASDCLFECARAMVEMEEGRAFPDTLVELKVHWDETEGYSIIMVMEG